MPSEYESSTACSQVEIGGLRFVFAVVYPCEGETFAQQASSVLKAVKRFSETDKAAIVDLSVFLADFADRFEFRRLAGDCSLDLPPSVAYLPQQPCGGGRLAVEFRAIQPGHKPLVIERIGDDLAVVRCGRLRLVRYAGHFPAPDGKPLGPIAAAAFQAIEQRLASGGCRLEDVVRTWFFIGNIIHQEPSPLLRSEGDCSGHSPECRENETVLPDRYEQFNHVRAEFYRGRRFAADRLPPGWNAPVFPASTGVGADGDGLTVSCLAVSGDRPGLVIFPLENPLQTPAYEYDDRRGEKSPKFARAMTVLHDAQALTFISGTASITTSDSKHLDSVAEQTRQTTGHSSVACQRRQAG